MKSVNPATGTLIAEFEDRRPDELPSLIQQADQAFSSWRKTSFADRAARMRAMAALLLGARRQYASLITTEMGKPIRQAIGEVEKCAMVCEYYAEHAEQMLSPEIRETEASKSYVRFDPLGVLLGIMPWNFPFWQVFRFAVPAVMGGNVILLKHAANVSGCAMAIQQLFHDSGFPTSVMTTLLISSDAIGSLIDNPVIRGISLTGSDAAGRSVAERAGRNLRKCVLELGGADPFIVLADADLKKAARVGAFSRLMNAGQSCIAAKRFIVEQSVVEKFQSMLKDEMRALKMGDPQDEQTMLGPMARADLRDELHTQVLNSVGAGAYCVMGGQIPDGPGYFYPPTLLADVRPGMPAFDDEMFGPVAALISVRNANEAVDVANNSRFGLGGSIWTASIEKAEWMAAEIQSGAIFINEMTKSDPRMPFGGVRDSGIGRELSEYGIREFMNIKSVWIA